VNVKSLFKRFPGLSPEDVDLYGPDGAYLNNSLDMAMEFFDGKVVVYDKFRPAQ
jgi:hypothetical protein